MVVKFLRTVERLEASRLPHACDCVFEVQGQEPPVVSIVIDGGWHEEVPSLSWKGTEKELKTIAKEFLEMKLDKERWRPTVQNNSLEIPNGEMEYRLRNGSFAK
jgi:hypothetical protein